MKNLLYKELRLMLHPVIIVFPILSGMLLIPDYPYFVPFAYAMLTVFMVFMLGREYKDNLFTIMLPVSKQQLKARCLYVVLIQMLQIASGIVFAMLRYYTNPIPNSVGIQANVALFGFMLMMYAVFNLVFLTMHYKTAYYIGIPAMFASVAGILVIIAVEYAIHTLPSIAFINSTQPADMLRQIPILLVGIGVYALLMWVAYKRSLPKFEQVDI